MIEYTDLPTINAFLNGGSFVLICLGYYFIKVARNTLRHKTCMIGAAICSAVFLVSYLIYHAKVGSVAYQGEGAIRWVYFSILISHTILAVINVPLVVATLYLGLSGKLQKHVRIARITFPIWAYVSVTGIAVYLMLYVWS